MQPTSSGSTAYVAPALFTDRARPNGPDQGRGVRGARRLHARAEARDAVLPDKLRALSSFVDAYERTWFLVEIATTSP